MKKTTILILILTLLMSIPVYAYDFTLDEFQTTALYEYGIFQGDETGNLNLDKNITRAEFCKVVLTAMGQSKPFTTYFNDLPEFEDVDITHWAYVYIKNAQFLSLVDGYDDGSFLPEAEITMNEAIKIIVNMLGYESMAMESGGYPDGYIKVAEKLNLLQDINFEGDSQAVRKDIASIMHIALDVPLMQIIGFGVETEYKIMDGTGGYPLVTLASKLEDIN